MSASNDFDYYNPNLKQAASEFRCKATEAELYLWRHALRAGQMQGYTLNRQRPVLDYIADFICQSLKLIIEVDGSTHRNDDIAVYDLERQGKLESIGFTVWRFSNEDVLHRITEVKRKIEYWIEEYEMKNGSGGRTRRN